MIRIFLLQIQEEKKHTSQVIQRQGRRDKNRFVSSNTINFILKRVRDLWGNRTLGSSPQNLIDAEVREALTLLFYEKFGIFARTYN